MIAIGATEISKVCLGSNELSKVCIGSEVLWPSSSPLPYDSEIEYLEGNINPFIETGIVPDDSTGIQIRVSVLNQMDQFLVGCRNNSSNTRWCIGKSSSYYYGYGGYFPNILPISNINDISVFSLNFYNNKKAIAYKESDPTTINEVVLSTLNFTPSYNIRLFGSAGYSGGSYTKASCRLYAVQITQQQTLVRDYIPVRVGEVGYMYDKVSGLLFGNDGDGSFVLGPDKTGA